MNQLMGCHCNHKVIKQCLQQVTVTFFILMCIYTHIIALLKYHMSTYTITLLKYQISTYRSIGDIKNKNNSQKPHLAHNPQMTSSHLKTQFYKYNKFYAFTIMAYIHVWYGFVGAETGLQKYRSGFFCIKDVIFCS